MSYDPILQAFLKSIEGATPIYTLTPQAARKVLDDAQKGKELPESEIEDTQIIGSKGKISIRIVRPLGHTKVLPVILYIHGGGWILGNKNTHDRLVREIANGSNAAVVFVNYTPSPEAKFPQAINESYEVLEYIHDHGVEHDLDPKKIVIMGDSVGGNMAAAVTMMAKDKKGPKILFQVLAYPVTDAGMNTPSYNEFAEGPWLTKKAMEWFWNAYEPKVENRKNKLASPLQATVEELQGLPPALVITDENDVLRDEGEAYAQKLNEAQVPVKAVRFKNTFHDFMMLNPISESPVTRDAITLVTKVLNQILHSNLVGV